MSRRREISRRLAALTEIAGILSAMNGLSALYHGDGAGELRLRRLLPLRDLPPPSRRHPYPPDLDLRPGDFLAGLTRHYLYAALNQVLYGSLMAENRQRLAHMDRALDRLDEDTRWLRLACNAERQEEIVEEIEIILLSADMLSPGGGEAARAARGECETDAVAGDARPA